MARANMRREYNYTVDTQSLISGVMPHLRGLVETGVAPLAAEHGLEVKREEKAAKTSHGHLIGGLMNYTWKGRHGLSPGFDIGLSHDPKNYLHVTVAAKPVYPIAYIVSLALGLLFSYFWIPYLIDSWGDLFKNWLFLGAVIVMWVVFLVLTRTIFISAVLAVVSTFAFGFIAGYGLGLVLGVALAASSQGGRVQPALEQFITGLDNPAPTAQEGLYGAPRRPAYPSYGAVKYASPAPPPSAPATPTPRIPTPKLVGGTSRPASSISMAACPQCRGPVAVGALNCPSCGLALQWS